MRKRLVIALLAVIATVGALAQVPPSISGGGEGFPYYYNSSTEVCLSAAEFAAALMPAEVRAQFAGVVVCPEPEVPPVDTGWWGLIKEWLNGKILYETTGPKLTKILAVLAGFVAGVQALKKLMGSLGKLGWLLKLIPGLSAVFTFLAHGIGPIILNAALTGGVMLRVAFEDGRLTGGEMLGVLTAILGADFLYRIVYDWLKLIPRNTGGTAGNAPA